MKRSLSLLPLCLLLSLTLYAQDQPPTYVFAISARQAAHFYQHPDDSLDVSTLPTPIDSFHVHYEEKERAPGHFLYVRPQLEQLDLELKSYYSYQLETRNNDRDLALELVDANGRSRADADISLRGRTIPFDETTQTYRRKHWLRDGLLTVSIDGDTLFYELKGNNTSPLLVRKIRYWRQSKVGYWLTSPIRWVEQSYHYLRRGIRWGDWRFYNNPFRFLKPENGFKGYIAANQPLYRPGDTLKVKAYLTNKKGKPWSKKVQLHLWSRSPQNYQTQYFIDSTLQIEDSGHVEFIWPVADTLPLDHNYFINFEHPRRKDFNAMQHRFRLEDYELDEASFSMDLKQSTYHRGEKVALQAQGRDQNSKIVPGAEVRLTLMVQKIHNIYQDSILVPDTLWTRQENLRDREPTQLMIPDSIFPAADLSLRLFAEFVHPSGELHQSEKNFDFRHRSDKLMLQLEGDSILATRVHNGQMKSGQAVLSRYGITPNELPIPSDTVTLPYREALSPYVEYYELETDSLYTDLEVWYDHQSQVQVSGKWQPDTIVLSFSNPRRLHINWLLQSRTREIRRGSYSDVGGQVKIPVGDQRQWELSYQYFWRDPISKEQKIYRLDKQLKVEIEQPPKVSPGERVQLKVKVQDQAGKPVPGVHLAAAAVNAQFENPADAYQAPVIPYKTSRAPFTLENFSVAPISARTLNTGKNGLSRAWFEKLNLQGYPFYQMRFRNPGVWMQWDSLQSDTFYRKVAQVAPYLIRDGKQVPVYLIYLNGELVHYFASEDHPPYSFIGQPGYNRISLRTRNREIILDSVWLEKGKKLELAVNLPGFVQGMSGIKMTQRKIAPDFSNQELYLLQKKTLALSRISDNVEQYFWDKTTNIHAVRSWPAHPKPLLITPFQADADVHLVRRGQLERSFLFEPGFIYAIAPTRERLYEWDSWDRFRDDLAKKSPKIHLPGQLILHPKDIKREAPAAVPPLYFNTFTQRRQSGKGRLRLLNIPTISGSPGLLAFNLQYENGEEWLFPSYRSTVGGLQAGKYQLFLVRADGKVLQKRFYITANQTLALNLSGDKFIKDEIRQWPEHLYKISKAPPKTPEEPGKEPSRILENPYRGIGQLIQGQITDESGEPLIGASILVSGTIFGTVTDFDGYYSIWVPENGAELEVSYTGYQSHTFSAFELSRQDVRLEAGNHLLEEVVVIGYGTARNYKKEVRLDPVQALQGRTAGIVLNVPGRQQTVTIPGLGEPAARQPLIIINGKTSSLEALQLLPADAITELKTLGGNEAKERYGVQAANGVYLITLRAGIPIPDPGMEGSEPTAGLRDNFRDYAFWQPKLVTDRQGEAYFQATFPDNITAWNTYVLGMDRKQRAGIGLARTKSWSSLTARLHVPRFLLSGDTVDIVGQAVNYSNDSLAVSTFFQQDDRELSRKNHRLGSSLTDHYRLTAPTADSIELIYGLVQEGYRDGEKRPVPIFPVGSMETEGEFMVLHEDSTLHLSFRKELPIELFIADNTLEVLIEELEFLKDYPHDCNEQTASRLIALELEKQIRSRLDQNFKHDRLIKKLVQKLEKAQLANGSWGWWPGSPSSHWISRHVLKALQLAQNSPEPTEAVRKGIRFLVNTLPEMRKEDQLLSLELLSEYGHQLDYNAFLNKIDSLELSLHDRLLVNLIRQRADLPYQLDTLDHYRQQTLYGTHYWGASLSTSWIYRRHDHPIASTLLAYELLKGAGRDQEARHALQYFMENRGIGQSHSRRAWYNTFETARILATLLPDLLREEGPFRKNQVKISDTIVDSFPYRATISGSRDLQIQKTGTGPVYIAAYQQYHNRQPAPKPDIFQLTSSLYQNEKITNSLEQGLPATLEVELKNDADAEYVMVEIPIPAACSYADRSINWALEDHREYRREKVVIYCSRLPAGTHTFRIQLEVRFSGRFTLNPARAEQMYFPVFFGRNGMKDIGVR